MGEIAEMMLDGTLCEGCGEWLEDDEPCGFPRRCASCQRDLEIADINEGALRLAATMKVKCPTCKKRVKQAGLKDHMRDVHGQK